MIASLRKFLLRNYLIVLTGFIGCHIWRLDVFHYSLCSINFIAHWESVCFSVLYKKLKYLVYVENFQKKSRKICHEIASDAQNIIIHLFRFLEIASDAQNIINHLFRFSVVFKPATEFNSACRWKAEMLALTQVTGVGILRDRYKKNALILTIH